MPVTSPTDGELADLLSAVKRGDDTDDLLDNERLASALGISLEEVASQLQAAKGRSLIWGTRSSRTPGPWFTDLEITVQGRRFLAPKPLA
jgi:hypothetical protein